MGAKSGVSWTNGGGEDWPEALTAGLWRPEIVLCPVGPPEAQTFSHSPGSPRTFTNCQHLYLDLGFRMIISITLDIFATKKDLKYIFIRS